MTDEQNPYADLFLNYISVSLEESLEQVKAAEPLVPEDERIQAWHVLDYGLQRDETWPVTRELLLELAPKMEQAGFREEWIAYLDRGVAQSQGRADVIAEVGLRIHIGYLYFLRSKFDDAKEWLNSCLDLLEGIDETDSLQAKVLNRLAFVSRRQQDLQTASVLVEKALALSEVDISEQANSYHVLGEISFHDRHWVSAESYHRRSLELWQQSGNLRQTAWELCNLGPALCEQGKFEEAISVFEEAISLLETIQDQYHIAVTQMNLGIVYAMCEQPQKALELYQAAEEIFRETQSTLDLAKVYTNQGMAYRKSSQWSKAQAAYTSSIKLWEQLGNTRSMANSLDELGLAYLGEGLYTEAIETFQQALMLVSKLDESPAKQRIHKMLLAHLDEANEKYYNGL